MCVCVCVYSIQCSICDITIFQRFSIYGNVELILVLVLQTEVFNALHYRLKILNSNISKYLYFNMLCTSLRVGEVIVLYYNLVWV